MAAKINLGTLTPSARDWNKMVSAVLRLEVRIQAIDYHDNADEYRKTDAELDIARETLREQLRIAPWGANGCVFVTIRSIRIRSGESIKELWINGRCRASLNDSGWLTVNNADDAEDQFQYQKTVLKRNSSEYTKRREEVAHLLWKAGNNSEVDWLDGEEIVPGWVFWSGQHGGRLSNSARCVSVSALGALRRAQQIEDREGLYVAIQYYGSSEEFAAERRYHGARY